MWARERKPLQGFLSAHLKASGGGSEVFRGKETSCIIHKSRSPVPSVLAVKSLSATKATAAALTYLNGDSEVYIFSYSRPLALLLGI